MKGGWEAVGLGEGEKDAQASPSPWHFLQGLQVCLCISLKPEPHTCKGPFTAHTHPTLCQAGSHLSLWAGESEGGMFPFPSGTQRKGGGAFTQPRPAALHVLLLRMA